MTRLIVTGTDTDIGKTVVAAMLTLALGGRYFKPVQCGTVSGTDREAVKHMTGLGDDRVLTEAVVLTHPLSPHLAAKLDHKVLAIESLTPPSGDIIVEGAGGLMVPLNRTTLMIDVFATWQMPVVLVARTVLGTLNHTLLSLESLRSRNIRVLGVIFVGDDHADNMQTISDMGKVKVLGRLPLLADLNKETLQDAFDIHFKRADFEASLLAEVTLAEVTT